MSTAAVTASDFGFVAKDLLTIGARVDTFTTFDRSAYLAVVGHAGSGLIAIGDQGLPKGPFTLRLEGARHAEFAQSLGLDARPQAGRVESREDRVGVALDGVPFLILAHATEWTPPAPPVATAAHVASAARRIAQLMHRAIAARGPEDPGLAPLAFDIAPIRTTSTIQAAAPLVKTLQRKLPDVIRSRTVASDIQSATTFLVGLGPGLTPSGDDLLGGLFIALTALGERAAVEALWTSIAPEINDLTNEISAMHLAVAADGFGSEPVHQLLAAILGGADDHAIALALDSVATIGHSSGLDTIAGMALAFEAWCAAGPDRRPAPRDAAKHR